MAGSGEDARQCFNCRRSCEWSRCRTWSDRTQQRRLRCGTSPRSSAALSSSADPVRLVVGERHPKIVHERQHLAPAAGQPQQQVRGLLCFLRPRFLVSAGGGGLARIPALMILRYSAAKRSRTGPYSRDRPASTALATASFTRSSKSCSACPRSVLPGEFAQMMRCTAHGGSHSQSSFAVHRHPSEVGQDADFGHRLPAPLAVRRVAGQQFGARHVQPPQLAFHTHPGLIDPDHRLVPQRAANGVVDCLQLLSTQLVDAYQRPHTDRYREQIRTTPRCADTAAARSSSDTPLSQSWSVLHRLRYRFRKLRPVERATARTPLPFRAMFAHLHLHRRHVEYLAPLPLRYRLVHQ